MSGSNGRDVERVSIPQQVMNSEDLHTMSQHDEPIDDIFEKIDLKQSGSIQLSELKYYLGNTPMCDVPLSNKLVDAFLDYVDNNSDQLVSRDGLKALVNNLVDTNRQSLVHQVLVTIASYVAPQSQISHCHRHYIDQYSCWPPPLFIPLMCVLQVVSWIVFGSILPNPNDGLYHDRKWSGLLEHNSTNNSWLGWTLNYNPNKTEEAWRFISHIFVHHDKSHLATNVVFSLVFGTLLEMVHCSWRIAILYIVGSISGPIALSTFYGTKVLQGSSGGLYALMAAHICNTVINWSEMKLRLPRVLILLALMATGIYLDIDKFTMFDDSPLVYQTKFEKKYLEGVICSTLVHFAGAVAGFLLGLMVLRNLKERKWEKVVKWIGLIVFVGLILACIILQIVFPDGLFVTFPPISQDTGDEYIIP